MYDIQSYGEKGKGEGIDSKFNIAGSYNYSASYCNNLKKYVVIFKLSDKVYNATYLEAGTTNNKNLWKESILQNQLSR